MPLFSRGPNSKVGLISHLQDKETTYGAGGTCDTRKQHKNTNAGEAPDSEQKASNMQHKAPFGALASRRKFTNRFFF